MSGSWTIFITLTKQPAAFIVCVTAQRCGYSLKPFGEPSALRDFDALIANRERTRFTRELLEQLPNLRIIAQTGNHAYHIDLPAAAALKIIVAKAAGGFSRSAGELAIGLMIAVMRQIPFADREIKNGHWPTPITQVLRGKTLGIVGLGHVGRHVAKIAIAFENESPRVGSAPKFRSRRPSRCRMLRA